MSDSHIVQWSNSYSVGVKLIDDQHMELINLTNKLFSNCMAGREKAKTTFMDTINEAVNYTGYHFSTEEKVMEIVHYPEFAAHKKEHANFVKEVYCKAAEFKLGKPLAQLNFVYFLRDWVIHHIAWNDKKVGAFLVALRRSGELQKISLRVKTDKVTQRVEFHRAG